MIKEFSRLQLFSIVDGRLSTTIEDIYDILNHICDNNLMTHHLPVAMQYVKMKNPKWLQDEKNKLLMLQALVQSNTFETLIGRIKDKNNDLVEIPQLKDEFDTSDFEQYMVDNSLLLKRFEKR